MTPAIGPFAVIAFLLELAAIAALAVFGFTCFEWPLSLVAGVGLPLLAIVLWGLFKAPRRRFQTPFWVRVAIEGLVIGGGAVALVAAGHPVLGAVMGGVALVAGIVNNRREYREVRQS